MNNWVCGMWHGVSATLTPVQHTSNPSSPP